MKEFKFNTRSDGDFYSGEIKQLTWHQYPIHQIFGISGTEVVCVK
ncbi:MAG: hypothetical protein PVH61_38945 [Candidatus Aminicenantes bacterium]|jgi:hypothetical protein